MAARLGPQTVELVELAQLVLSQVSPAMAVAVAVVKTQERVVLVERVERRVVVAAAERQAQTSGATVVLVLAAR